MDIMVESMLEHGLIQGAQAVYNDFGDTCGNFAKQYTLAQFLLIGAAALVAIINTVLKGTIQGMANFEHHHSLSAATKGVSTNIAVALFVNTAVVVMLVNASIQNEALNSFGIGMGEADDFDFQWYTNVGTAIVMTMVLNAVTPHMAPLAGYYVVGPLKRCLASASSTQRTLNKKYEVSLSERRSEEAASIAIDRAVAREELGPSSRAQRKAERSGETGGGSVSLPPQPK